MTAQTDRRALGVFGFQKGFVSSGFDPPINGYLQLVVGGTGSGKSEAGAMRGLRYYLHFPKADGLITAPTLDLMHKATLTSLWRVFARAGLQQNVDWDYHKRDEIIEFSNGARWFLMSADKPERITGMDVAWFWMDEPKDSPVEAFFACCERIRQQGFPHQGWMTTTPIGLDHWTFKLFDSEQEIELAAGQPVTRRTYHAPTRDNPHGGAQHHAMMAAVYGNDELRIRQQLEGEFVRMEGLAYPAWNPKEHMVPVKDWPVKPADIRHVACGVDFGYENPFALLVEGYDGEGRRYLIDEHYESHLSEDEACAIAEEKMRRWHIERFVCDVEDPRWRKAMIRWGLPAIKAKREVLNGRNPSSSISNCALALRHRLKDGSQAFFVNPDMKHFQKEIENYVRNSPQDLRDPSEQPRRQADHLMDAWRYAEMYIKRVWDLPPQTVKPHPIRLQIGAGFPSRLRVVA